MDWFDPYWNWIATPAVLVLIASRLRGLIGGVTAIVVFLLPILILGHWNPFCG